MGRPTKPGTAGQRNPLGLRVTAETKRKLEAAALKSGRSQSQEAEFRIVQSLIEEKVYGGRELHGLLRLMVGAAEMIQVRMGKPLFSDWDTWNAAQVAWAMLMKEAAPMPPPEFDRFTEQSKEFTWLPQPPSPPTFPNGTDDTAELAAFETASRKYSQIMRKYDRLMEEQRREAQEWVARVTDSSDLGRDVAAGLLPDRATVSETANAR